MSVIPIIQKKSIYIFILFIFISPPKTLDVLFVRTKYLEITLKHITIPRREVNKFLEIFMFLFVRINNLFHSTKEVVWRPWPWLQCPLKSSSDFGREEALYTVRNCLPHSHRVVRLMTRSLGETVSAILITEVSVGGLTQTYETENSRISTHETFHVNTFQFCEISFQISVQLECDFFLRTHNFDNSDILKWIHW